MSDKTDVDALVKRLRAEEARTIRLFDFVVTERDKRELGPDGFTLLNSIKHAISGRDPVLTEAAAVLTAQAATIKRLTDEFEEAEDQAKAELALQLLAREGQSADRTDAAFDAGLEAAAKVAEDMAPYTEEAIQKATGSQILDNLCAVTKSSNSRKIATAIRALKGAEEMTDKTGMTAPSPSTQARMFADEDTIIVSRYSGIFIADPEVQWETVIFPATFADGSKWRLLTITSVDRPPLRVRFLAWISGGYCRRRDGATP